VCGPNCPAGVTAFANARGEHHGSRRDHGDADGVTADGPRDRREHEQESGEKVKA
jgi:hypothetical protein